jgi:syndecan 4
MADCNDCGAGTYSSTGSTKCELCISGAAQPSGGSPSCSVCPAGEYAPGTVDDTSKCSSDNGSGGFDCCAPQDRHSEEATCTE